MLQLTGTELKKSTATAPWCNTRLVNAVVPHTRKQIRVEAVLKERDLDRLTGVQTIPQLTVINDCCRNILCSILLCIISTNMNESSTSEVQNPRAQHSIITFTIPLHDSGQLGSKFKGHPKVDWLCHDNMASIPVLSPDLHNPYNIVDILCAFRPAKCRGFCTSCTE